MVSQIDQIYNFLVVLQMVLFYLSLFYFLIFICFMSLFYLPLLPRLAMNSHSGALHPHQQGASTAGFIEPLWQVWMGTSLVADDPILFYSLVESFSGSRSFGTRCGKEDHVGDRKFY
jgi:hypothetical protein